LNKSKFQKINNQNPLTLKEMRFKRLLKEKKGRVKLESEILVSLSKNISGEF